MRLKQFLMEAAAKKKDELSAKEVEEAKELKLTKKEIVKLTEEWKLLQAQTEVLTALTKKINARSNELESILLPIVEKEESKTMLVKNAMLEFKPRKTTGVAYAKIYARALELVNEEQVKVLEEYKEAMTTSDTKKSLNLIDPKLAKLASDIKVMSNEELIAMLAHVKGVVSDGPLDEANIMDLIKQVAHKIKECFGKVRRAQNKSMKAANALMAAAKG